MFPVGFEPTISMLERAKTVRTLDRAAAAIGGIVIEEKSAVLGETSYSTTLSTTNSTYLQYINILLDNDRKLRQREVK
jgi:hypothetical protein